MKDDRTLSDELAYQALIERLNAADQRTWETPALALTALAFLFTLALGPGTAPFARILSSVLALGVSLAAFQLMYKQRQLANYDLYRAKEIENRLAFLHSVVDRREAFKHVPFNKVSSRNSHRIWLGLLLLFAGASLATIFVPLIWPSILSGVNR
jgi:hypothetical protein